MERTIENLDFCEEQILRLAVIRFWDRLTDRGKIDLRDALCDSSDSRAKAEMRMSAWILTQRDLPMPADFTMMAMDEKREARAQESWKQSPEPKFSGCPKCGGSGWHLLHTLTTREGRGGSVFTKTDFITRDVFDSFNGGKLDPQTQSAASGAEKCDCGAIPGTYSYVEPPWSEEKRRAWDAQYTAALKNPKNLKMVKGKPGLQKIISALGKDVAGDEGDEVKEPGDTEGDKRKEPVSATVVLPFRKKEPA